MVAALRDQAGFEHYDKGASVSIFARLLKQLPLARVNAARALVEAIDDDEMNPSTRMHLLIDVFEELGKLKPV